MTSTRIAIIAGTLLLAGAARAATSSSVPSEVEKSLEASAPVSAPYLDFTSCNVNSKAVTAALLQVPDQDRGSVLAASGCAVASNETVPTKVDERDRR